MVTKAQQKVSNATLIQTAFLEPPSANDPARGAAGAAAGTASSSNATPAGATTVDSGTASATPGSNATPTSSNGVAAGAATVAPPGSRDAVIKELAAMKARIAQLEAELKTRTDADDAADAEKDANTLRNAEGDATGTATLGQTAAAPPPAAAPAPPEISAETTTKEAPFPGDWTWLNSGGHNVDSPMATKYFTPEIRFDANYILDYNHPVDDSMGGSTEMFRSDEWQLEQVSVGGDFRIQNVRGRILTMDGLFATTTPRNDASYNRGQWQLSNAYRYFSEAWGGYHWDVNHGLNVDAGIFVSYIGLFSYYNFDNWAYQPSFVSSNTPWFFNGLRIQWWPTKNLKIEPWIINGWQSYARYNGKPGLGGQILWRPKPYLDFVWNDYGLGEDDAGYPGRSRVHADYSAQVKFYDKPKNMLDKIAWTLTGDAGCEYGGGPASGPYSPQGLTPLTGTSSTYSGGVNCHNSQNGKPKQMFVGTMSYMRFWFNKDIYAVTLGGGLMNNPGRYLTLLPPINGATATSGTPYYTENGGDRAQMHDGTITFDYMPAQFITFRLEESYRYSDTPYWTGHGGITPPSGNNGNPADYQCAAGGDSGVGYVPTALGASQGFSTGQAQAISNCVGLGQNNGYGGIKALWWPDLRTNQTSTILAVMVRF
jgi:Putative beta-barrel porin-2, OmpL-like. bbp2